jgi:nucleoside 2-deoxyribosyltransferase
MEFQPAMHRRVYIASSWRNADGVKLLADFLRDYHMEVFAFVEQDKRADGLDKFIFNAKDWDGKVPLDKMDWIDFMDNPKTERAYRADKAGLDWADTVILLLPCGRSAHLEAGYAVGKGKELYVWGDLPIGQFETMYGFADGLFRFDELPKLLKVLTNPKR